MSQKRIELDVETLRMLRELSPELAAAPHSTPALESAIKQAAKMACQGVQLTEPHQQLVSDVTHFGLYGSREDVVATAIEHIRPEMSAELQKQFESRYAAE